MVNKVILIGNVGAETYTAKTSIIPIFITSYYGEDWLKSSKSMSKKECVFISKDGFVPVPGTTRME